MNPPKKFRILLNLKKKEESDKKFRGSDLIMSSNYYSMFNVTVSWKKAYPWSVEASSCYHTRHKEVNQSYGRYMQIGFVHSCSVSIYATHFHG